MKTLGEPIETALENAANKNSQEIKVTFAICFTFYFVGLKVKTLILDGHL